MIFKQWQHAVLLSWNGHKQKARWYLSDFLTLRSVIVNRDFNLLRVSPILLSGDLKLLVVWDAFVNVYLCRAFNQANGGRACVVYLQIPTAFAQRKTRTCLQRTVKLSSDLFLRSVILGILLTYLRHEGRLPAAGKAAMPTGVGDWRPTMVDGRTARRSVGRPWLPHIDHCFHCSRQQFA